MKFRPMGDRLIIEPPAVKTKTESGLHIPDSAQQKKSVSQKFCV